MISIGQLFPKSPRGIQAEVRLQSAYQAFAAGSANKQDAELILVDLALVSGYFEVQEPGVSNEALQNMAGARRVYGRIVRMVSMPEKELAALITAAANELNIENAPQL